MQKVIIVLVLLVTPALAMGQASPDEQRLAEMEAEIDRLEAILAEAGLTDSELWFNAETVARLRTNAGTGDTLSMRLLAALHVELAVMWAIAAGDDIGSDIWLNGLFDIMPDAVRTEAEELATICIASGYRDCGP